ncbi:tubulin-like doman-containing protein [Streptomyces sp. NPDC003832]
MPVPLLEISPDWLNSWARLVTGTAYGGVDGVVTLVGADRSSGRGLVLPASSEPRPADSAVELVKRFRATASPEAFRLAGYFAAAPLTLPVMRLVQRVMTRSPRPAHLAEVFVSGLLVRRDDGEAPEQASYDFVPGVREVLLGTIRVSEMRRVGEELSDYVGSRMGQARDAAALLRLPWGAGNRTIEAAEQPFARLPPEVLRRMGFTEEQTAPADTATAPEGPRSRAEPGHEGERDEDTGARDRQESRLTWTHIGTGSTGASLWPVSKVYQPMLFVGLGGTGGRIGAELEAGLRYSLCGPDGAALTHTGRPRHQLPSYLQFVYADYSESEVARLPHLSVDRALRPAFEATARATHQLLPHAESSPEVTRLLRAAAHEATNAWLPPPDGEPRVTPLRDGAGQLPTVGRAALFETLRSGLHPVLQPLLEAIDSIARSGGDLMELGRGRIRGCDVFVAFSVAGGTGAGIFLDYLHLIGQAFRLARFPGVRIYPLVVMPSAFPDSAGGGREAELNAARALVDLFHLVDEQNAPAGDDPLERTLQIEYPGGEHIRLAPATVPTAFLFGGSGQVPAEELRRSAASLVMSFIGTEPAAAPDGRPLDEYDTFAHGFTDTGLHRARRAGSGIGASGVSTSLVASMFTPVDELADLFSARMLAAAVRDLTGPAAASRREYWSVIRQMFTDTGLEDLWTCDAPPVPEPAVTPRGGPAIEAALRDRIAAMESQLAELQSHVALHVPQLMEQLSPRAAIRKLLRHVDPFRLEQALSGVPGSADEVEQLGFGGMLSRRGDEYPRPSGIDEHGPVVPHVQRRLGGLARARWDDADVVAARAEQDRWYEWRARNVWHTAVREQRERWYPAVASAQRELSELVAVFSDFAEQEAYGFAEQVRRLYDERVGTALLLPARENLDDLYAAACARLIVSEAPSPDTPDGPALHLRMLNAEDWQIAYYLGRRDRQSAVHSVRAALAAHLRTVLLAPPTHPGGRRLLPSMTALFQAAIGRESTVEAVPPVAAQLFRAKLMALLPPWFTPEGTGPLKVLVQYPAVEDRTAAEEYLRNMLLLPSHMSVEFRESRAESVSVLLFRSEMGLTDVPEVRGVLQEWDRASLQQGRDDLLKWRQRLGYRDDWMVSSEGARSSVLHHLLCMMWNGQLDVEGDPASPRSVRILVAPGHDSADAAGVTLRLAEPPAGLSSWAGLLKAYERWVVLEESPVAHAYGQTLMKTLPTGLARVPTAPSRLFLQLLNDVAPAQIALLRRQAMRAGPNAAHHLTPLRHFWEQTFPAALDHPFLASGRAAAPDLRRLVQVWDGGPDPASDEDGDPSSWTGPLPWDQGPERVAAPWDDRAFAPYREPDPGDGGPDPDDAPWGEVDPAPDPSDDA